ncbi:MAG: Gfo/Idh/MocA family oxidoreductase [Pseudomonadota bacterium]
MTTNGTIGIGLVGFGLAGRCFHSPFFAPAGFAFRACATSQPAELASAFPGVDAVATPQALFARDDVDLVVIASPNATHAPLARAALDAGKHVLVDKPFTLDVGTADALIALARDRGLLLAAYHNRRFDGDFQLLRHEVEAGRLGRVLSFESRIDRFKAAGLRGWRSEATAAGSGLLYDLGPHLIDQMLVLLGPPQWLFADLATDVEGGGVDDAFCLRCGGDGWRATLLARTMAADHTLRFEVHGERGSLVKTGFDAQEAAVRLGTSPLEPGFGVEASQHAARFTPADGGPARLLTAPPGRWLSFYEAMHAAIATGAPPPVTPDEARAVVAIIDAARESDATGRRVALHRWG